MNGKYRNLLRLGGLGVLLFALLGGLPAPWNFITAVAGGIIFFAAGPT